MLLPVSRVDHRMVPPSQPLAVSEIVVPAQTVCVAAVTVGDAGKGIAVMVSELLRPLTQPSCVQVAQKAVVLLMVGRSGSVVCPVDHRIVPPPQPDALRVVVNPAHTWVMEAKIVGTVTTGFTVTVNALVLAMEQLPTVQVAE